MNRKKITSLILITLLTIMPIISVVMMYHITLCDTLSKMDSGCYGDMNTMFKLNENQPVESVINSVDALEQKVALYTEQKYDDYKIKAIYFNRYYINYPMKSGRFFSKDDLVYGNYVAVVGKGLQNQVYSRNEKSYIELAGQEYQVIGVIGFDAETVIDDYVYINMFVAEDCVESNIYTLDIWGKEDTSSEKFSDLLQQQGISSEELTTTKSYGMTLVPQIAYGRWFIGLLLCNLLCIVVISVQWISLQKNEIGIRRLVGANIYNIIGYVTVKYLRYVVVSIVISFVLCSINFGSYIPAVVVGYIIILPVMLFIIYISVTKTVKIPLSEAIML